MNGIIKPFWHYLSQRQVDREIAPGVWVRVRRAPAGWTAPPFVQNVGARVQDAWAVLRGRARAMDVPPHLDPARRRAA